MPASRTPIWRWRERGVRRRWREWRPGFMASAVAAGLLGAPAFGLLADRLHDERVIAEARAQELTERTRADLVRSGWQAVGASGAIELMQAAAGFRIELGSGSLTGARPSPGRVEQARRILHGELSRYPAALLESSHLRRVLLCEGLREGGRPIPSLPNYEQSLLLDVDAPEPYLRRLVHHEVYHFIDFAEDEQVKADPGWEALNDRWFSYGSGGRFMRDPGSTRFVDDLPGFVSRYATSAVEEDKAEVFALLMADPARLERMAVRDPVLAAKVVTIKRRVQALAPEVNASFWQRQEGGS